MLLLINKDWSTAQINKVIIRSNSTFCLKTEGYGFAAQNRLLKELLAWREPYVKPVVIEPEPVKVYEPALAGSSSISGVITDATGGAGIPGALVMIKGYRTGTNTKSDGRFIISNIKEGNYTIVIASVGYNQEEVKVTLSRGQASVMNTQLTVSTNKLEEVVVLGYGVLRKKSITGSTATIKIDDLTSTAYSNNLGLSGKVAGLSVSNGYLAQQITIRGIGTTSGANKPIYVIDGIIYDEMPPNIKPDMIISMEVLKDAAAIALYGPRAADGVIVITTGAKSIRSIFKDYAFWQPELNTGSKGKATFEVTYPDNITGWEMYVLGMDKKLRVGKGTSFTNAFKPVAAQLNTPQFLIEGDSAQFIGKALNYTKDAYAITTTFSLFNKMINTSQTNLPANASVNSSLPVLVTDKDTVKASFTLTTTTGFKDGEERKIPILKQGTEETQGKFYMVRADTSITFTPKQHAEPVMLYVENNTLDLLLDELRHLKEYPYY